MTGETALTLVGNLTAAPELRYTQAGVPVLNFTVASTPRTFDRQANEWRDGDALFVRCALWRAAAENASTLDKGTRVIVTGVLKQRAYQDRDGNNRTSLELDVEEMGPSLRYATAQVTRVTSSDRRPSQPSQPRQDQEPWQGARRPPSGQQEQWHTPRQGEDYGDDTPF